MSMGNTVLTALICGTAGAATTYIVATKDIAFDFNASTKAAMEEQNLKAEHVCRELVKSQQAVMDEFNSRGYDLPTVTMSMDECLARTILPQLLNQRP